MNDARHRRRRLSLVRLAGGMGPFGIESFSDALEYGRAVLVTASLISRRDMARNVDKHQPP